MKNSSGSGGGGSGMIVALVNGPKAKGAGKSGSSPNPADFLFLSSPQEATAESAHDEMTTLLPLTTIVALSDPGTGDTRHYMYIPFIGNRSRGAVESSTPAVVSPDKAAKPSPQCRDAEEVSPSLFQRTKNIGDRRISFLGNLYEIQRMKSPSRASGPGGTPKTYGSFFVDSMVISNGELSVMSRIDPLFFALCSSLPKTAAKWVPLNQIIAEVPLPIQLALSDYDDTGSRTSANRTYSQLDNLLERTDKFEGLILYRFSRDRAIKWLVEKVQRATEAVRRRTIAARRKDDAFRAKNGFNSCGDAGAFCDSFNLSKPGTGTNESISVVQEMSSSELEDDEEQRVKSAGMQLVCEYLTEEWRASLLSFLKMSSDALEPKLSNGQANKRKATWEGGQQRDDEADKLLHYTLGVDGNGGVPPPSTSSARDDFGKSASKKEQTSQSVGLKKLAKVNTKGMKSLASFFGGGAKKKRKL